MSVGEDHTLKCLPSWLAQWKHGSLWLSHRRHKENIETFINGVWDWVVTSILEVGSVGREESIYN